MAENANAALMRRGYDAFSSGDLGGLSELFAEDAAWHEPGTSQIAGDYVGRDQVFELFGKLVRLSAGTFKADATDIFADDRRAVAIQHSTGTRDGKVLDTEDVLVFEISNGKVVDVRLFPGDVDQESTFWS